MQYNLQFFYMSYTLFSDIKFIYILQVIAADTGEIQEEQVQVEFKKEEILNENTEPKTKLKYPCTKCTESFQLKIDLKVSFFIMNFQFNGCIFLNVGYYNF